MRIISGKLGGRRLDASVGPSTRPTSDRVREGLGSALAARCAFDDARVLDLFAGTGALGFEALSRGARHVVAVERDRQALQSIRQNARALGVEAELELVTLDLLKAPTTAAARLKALAVRPFTLIFADPPYSEAARMPELLAALLDAELCAEDALFVLEHPSEAPALDVPRFQARGHYRYGDTGITLLARIP